MPGALPPRDAKARAATPPVGDHQDPPILVESDVPPTAASDPVVYTPEDPPRGFGSWAHLHLLQEIGHGAFGRVYRAWDPMLAREVALKIIDVAERETAASVLAEGRMLARVRHPNVVTVYGAQQVGREVGLWMELVRGRSLAEIVQSDGSLGGDEATLIASSLCRALAAVHGAGLVHRDVKAHNVMREQGGRIVLMDFGAGRELSQDQTAQAYAAGTPLYMAPEVIAGRPATPASDLYSLGVLLHFLVTRHYPIEGRSFTDLAVAHGVGRRRLLADLRPDLPDRFVQVVEQALSPHPAQRHATAGAMLRALIEAPAAGVVWPVEPSGQATEQPTVRPGSAEPLNKTAAFRVAALKVTAFVAAAFIGIWFAGALTSLAFNITLGRPAAFAGDTMAGWWGWGLRSLIAPAVSMALATVPFLVIGSAWRLTASVSSRVGASSRRLSAQLESVKARLHLTDPVILGQIVLALQLVALAVVVWRFGDLMNAFATNISSGDAAALDPLRPENLGDRLLYRLTLDVLLLGMGVAWLQLLKRRRRSGITSGRAVVTAGLAVAGTFLLLLIAPYRIFSHNSFPRVTFESARCYLIGERPGELLLYCPDIAPPRNRIVASTDSTVSRDGIMESLFSRAQAMRP